MTYAVPDGAHEPWALSLAEAASLIGSGRLSPLELAESIVSRVAAVDPALTAFAHWDPEQVLTAARDATELPRRSRPQTRLFGIPVSLKDLIDWRGVPTRAGSQATPATPADSDAHISSLLRRAGAIFLGKVHTHEFAYGTTTPRSGNPHDPTRSPGGSSGGSGAAVAAGLGPVSLGTDTGGSVRIPASLCGVVGFKPTAGTVGRSGLRFLSWSLDTIGVLARTVEDAAITLSYLTGPDHRDRASLDVPPRDFAAELGSSPRGLTVGIPTGHYWDDCDPGVAASCRAATAALKELGVHLRPIDLPYADQIVGIGNEIVSAESGESVREAVNAGADRIGGFERSSCESGALHSAVTYVHALKAREVVKDAWREALAPVDLVAMPTTPVTAPRRGESRVRVGDVDRAVGAALIKNTYCANIVGLPSLSLPVGMLDGLPVGLQLVGKPLQDGELLAVGHAYAASRR